MTPAERARTWRAAHPGANSEASKTYREKHPERVAATQRRARLRHLERFLLRNARRRATDGNLPFDIVEADIVIPARCPVLGIELRPGEARGRNDSSPSLDRIDPALGYVKGNIAVISNRANRLKNDGSADEHERIAAWIRKAGSS